VPHQIHFVDADELTQYGSKTPQKNGKMKEQIRFSCRIQISLICRKGAKYYETSMIRLTQTSMKIQHASSIRPVKNKLFTNEILVFIYLLPLSLLRL
jgi:hypothetical protein